MSDKELVSFDIGEAKVYFIAKNVSGALGSSLGWEMSFEHNGKRYTRILSEETVDLLIKIKGISK